MNNHLLSSFRWILGAIALLCCRSLPAQDSLALKSNPAKDSLSKKTAPVPGPVFKAYDPKLDVMLFPPTPPCTLNINTRNEFSGAVVRQTAYAPFFQCSNPALKSFLDGKTQIICEAALSQNGSSRYLWLKFTINDPNARKSFGRMERDALAALRFMDGSLYSLQTLKNVDGDFDPQSQAMIYEVQYALDGAAFKRLRKTELDKIRVAWSAGYEDYEIQQVDVLSRLARCLED